MHKATIYSLNLKTARDLEAFESYQREKFGAEYYSRTAFPRLFELARKGLATETPVGPSEETKRFINSADVQLELFPQEESGHPCT